MKKLLLAVAGLVLGALLLLVVVALPEKPQSLRVEIEK